MPPAASQKPLTYDVQERVLCFHGPMLYEAKVLEIRKAEDKKDPPEYKVHYKGWKNTFVSRPLFFPPIRCTPIPLDSPHLQSTSPTFKSYLHHSTAHPVHRKTTKSSTKPSD
jgi:hypothetical protein